MKRFLPPRRRAARPVGISMTMPDNVVIEVDQSNPEEMLVIVRDAPQPNPYEQPDGRIQVGPTDI